MLEAPKSARVLRLDLTRLEANPSLKAGSLNPHTGCSEKREHLAITAPTLSRVSNTLSVLRKRVHVIAPITVGPPSKLSESRFRGAVPVACWWLSLWVWALSLLGLVVRLLCSAFSLSIFFSLGSKPKRGAKQA